MPKESEYIRDHKFCPECGAPDVWIQKIGFQGSVPGYRCEECEAEYWQVITS